VEVIWRRKGRKVLWVQCGVAPPLISSLQRCIIGRAQANGGLQNEPLSLAAAAMERVDVGPQGVSWWRRPPDAW
jgi:hypothetical protein